MYAYLYYILVNGVTCQNKDMLSMLNDVHWISDALADSSTMHSLHSEICSNRCLHQHINCLAKIERRRLHVQTKECVCG